MPITNGMLSRASVIGPERLDASRVKHRILKTRSQNQGLLKMQFIILFSRHPDKAQTPAPADLRDSEFQTVRGLYTDGLIQQVWLRGDAGGACMIAEGASTDEVAAKAQRATSYPRRLHATSHDRAAEALFGLRSPLLTGKRAMKAVVLKEFGGP
jgi:hypothetical protein